MPPSGWPEGCITPTFDIVEQRVIWPLLTCWHAIPALPANCLHTEMLRSLAWRRETRAVDLRAGRAVVINLADTAVLRFVLSPSRCRQRQQHHAASINVMCVIGAGQLTEPTTVDSGQTPGWLAAVGSLTCS